MTRLGLGTAQFGLDYGITNAGGQVGESEAAAILALAADSGIDTLDTAAAYGDSEGVIGRHWPAGAEFRVVTKAKAGSAAAEQLGRSLGASLEALGRTHVYAFLLHDASDVLGPNAPRVWAAMEELKSAGLATKLGVSVYEGDEVDAILSRFPIDIVQVPFNAVDRRLIAGGQLRRLADAGVEIHARSLFLQGLLLSPAEKIPAKFAPIRSAVEHLDRTFERSGLNRLEGLLASAFECAQIDRFIVGVTSTIELEAILAAAARAEQVERLDLELPDIDPRYLNPARWHELS